MGELENQESDKLDEQIWGSDEEDEEGNDSVEKEEFGPGSGKETENELVAKDDNQDGTEGDQQDQEKQKDSNEEEKIRKQEEIDQREGDEDQFDHKYGKDEIQEAPESMDLPDDLKLDDDNLEGDEKADEDSKDNPLDLDHMVEERDIEEAQEDDQEDEPMEMEDHQDEKQDEGDTEDTGKDEAIEKIEEKGDSVEDGDKGQQDINEPGVLPQDEPQAGETVDKEEMKGDKNQEDAAQAAEVYGKKTHDSQGIQQADNAQDTAPTSQNEQERNGVGVSESQQQEGHEGEVNTSITRAGSHGKQQQQHERKPGHSDSKRTLGSADEEIRKRLKTIDTPSTPQKEVNPEKDSDLFEHLQESSGHYDNQTMDVANADQQKAQEEQATPNIDEDGQPVSNDDDICMMDTEDIKEQIDTDKLSSAQLREKMKNTRGGYEENEEENGEQIVSIPGEFVKTEMVQRGPESTIHSALQHYPDVAMDIDLEQLRQRLEAQLGTWHQPRADSLAEEQIARDLWQNYEALTAGLSQELCEHLRLILEPSQATKLKGDYRTGKRLNMRKVIPYIASQFRKDKIWLRRTKPSKRNYQIMIAVDDSSSMADNHSKQLAFESLATVANALTLLEAGQLAICSFGECVQLLHPFHEQFTCQSGASVLTQFTFEQKKTKIAQLLEQATGLMLNARSHQRGRMSNIETSQLLLIVSDGRGLFLDGMEVVKSAIRQARNANVFTVFVILDNMENKDSILDIKVPVFKEGKLPEIKSYMDHFPFPFYIILRDINSLPNVLSDALRQWFELVTSADR